MAPPLNNSINSIAHWSHQRHLHTVYQRLLPPIVLQKKHRALQEQRPRNTHQAERMHPNMLANLE